MRSTRTRRRLAFTLAFFAIATLVFIVVFRDIPSERHAVATPTVFATLTPALHPTYSYLVIWPQPDGPWHRGATLVFTYKPMLVSYSQSGIPDTVDCTVELFGPYRTAADAQTAFILPVPPNVHPTKPIWISPTLTTDDWTSATQTQTVTIPALAPGYYFAEDTQTYNTGAQSGTNSNYTDVQLIQTESGGHVIEIE